MYQQQPMSPQQVMYNQFMSRVQSDPIAKRVFDMCQGKSPEELAGIVQNLGNSAGMSKEQLNQFLSQYGLNL